MCLERGNADSKAELVCPGYRAVGIVESRACRPEEVIMARSHPAEFRRKVLDLVEAGRPVAEIADQLGVTGQTIYNWRNQDLVDRGLRPGVSTAESVELAAARRRIRELETELAVTRRAFELLKEQTDQKRRFEVVAAGVGDGYPVEVACRVVGVSVSGYYCLRRRAPSAAFGATRDAAGGHRRDPSGVSAHLWISAGPRRAGARPWPAGSALHRGVGHAPQRPRRAARSAPTISITCNCCAATATAPRATVRWNTYSLNCKEPQHETR